MSGAPSKFRSTPSFPAANTRPCRHIAEETVGFACEGIAGAGGIRGAPGAAEGPYRGMNAWIGDRSASWELAGTPLKPSPAAQTSRRALDAIRRLRAGDSGRRSLSIGTSCSTRDGRMIIDLGPAGAGTRKPAHAGDRSGQDLERAEVRPHLRKVRQVVLVATGERRVEQGVALDPSV